MNNEELIKKAIDNLEPEEHKESKRKTYVIKPNVYEFLELYQAKRGYKSESETINKAIEHLIQLLSGE